MPTELFERSRKGEHALLIQPHRGGPPDEGALEEFAELAVVGVQSGSGYDEGRPLHSSW